MEMLNKSNNKVEIIGLITINDLREFDFNGKELTHIQHLALKNFDRYKIHELNQELSEDAFQLKFQQIHVMANLSSFEEFLKEEYFA